MANPATVTDIESRWRSLSTAETIVATSLLGDAWEILLARVPLLQTRIDDETLSENLVIGALCSMVLRVLRNPDGKRQESIDDYSWTRDNAVSAGLLYATDEEIGLLSPTVGGSDAYTIRPQGAPGYAVSVPLNYWELNL